MYKYWLHSSVREANVIAVKPFTDIEKHNVRNSEAGVDRQIDEVLEVFAIPITTRGALDFATCAK